MLDDTAAVIGSENLREMSALRVPSNTAASNLRRGRNVGEAIDNSPAPIPKETAKAVGRIESSWTNGIDVASRRHSCLATLLFVFLVAIWGGPLQIAAAELSLDRELPSSVWRLGRWELHFEADHVIRVDGGDSISRVWHWWATGPQTLHLQSAADPASYAKEKGVDYTFDAAMTKFVGGKSGEIVGTKILSPAAAMPSSIVPDPTKMPAAAVKEPTGISIAGVERGRTAVQMSTGGHSHEIGDVRALLSSYGEVKADLGPHPEAEIFDGIPYLMSLREAEKVLMPQGAGSRSGSKIACAGFPEGLSWVAFSGHWAWYGRNYNRLYIVTDIQNRAVAIEFVSEDRSWAQPVPPWQTLGGNWHVMDYVNAEVKGQSGVHVDTQVLDNRSDKHRIVVHTNNRRRCSATLFLPEPLINLMLYSTRDATVK